MPITPTNSYFHHQGLSYTYPSTNPTKFAVFEGQPLSFHSFSNNLMFTTLTFTDPCMDSRKVQFGTVPLFLYLLATLIDLV